MQLAGQNLRNNAMRHAWVHKLQRLRLELPFCDHALFVDLNLTLNVAASVSTFCHASLRCGRKHQIATTI